MPRKAIRTEKPSLHFLERPLCGAKLQHVPEVRAALNPKEYFTETQEHNSSASSSWVSPQFDSSVEAATVVRRGKRKCQSATSILGTCSPLSKKNSVCKFPALSFQTRSRAQSHQPKSARTKKAAESTAESDSGNRPQGLCQIKKTVSSAPKRQSVSNRKKNVARSSDGATSSSRCLDQPKTLSIQGARCRLQEDGASTPASSEFNTSEFSSVSPAPDVDTPKVIQDGSSCPPSPTVHLLLAEPCTPPCNQPPDILVPDTPEGDYGLKVTWRRRRGQMLLLKERGHLADSDVLIQS
ncbi:RAD9, HUS1, RAD1-interacting nuclear orphan protein 1 [Echeneis naucrates]|uniref:Uncharacterized protein n=1 Tax=Echeneis naucrates TaxID=173247 RepID=A0A665VBH8_ECHNA|nr:RAD9, HUS1, RAD1-interacting nuclear orphan protein 1 [Echeneis naucrates]